MKKRVLSLLLTLTMLLSLVPAMGITASAAGNVAQVGGTGYETLQEAVNEANSGDIVTLLSNVTNNDTLGFDVQITLAENAELTNENSATLKWDLSNGLEGYGCIKNFQYYSNLGIQSIKVPPVPGEYVIATGDLSSLMGKDTFTLTGVGGLSDVTITINGAEVTYNDQYFRIVKENNGTPAVTDDDKLVLHVGHSPIGYIDADGETQTCTDYTVVTGGTIAWNAGYYVVMDEDTTIDAVGLNGNVTLILCDGAKLTVIGNDSSNGHAINVGDYELTITAGSAGSSIAGTGKLEATGYTYNMGGFSGIYSSGDGEVIINGGNVEAIGGNASEDLSTGGDGFQLKAITVNGGTVTATGGTDTSDWGVNGNGIKTKGVSITGGTVAASGYYGIAAIGSTTATTLSITGGTVNAKGSEFAIISGCYQSIGEQTSMVSAILTIANTMQVTGASGAYTAGTTWYLTNQSGAGAAEYVTVKKLVPVASVNFGGSTGVKKYTSVQIAINEAVDGVSAAANARTVKLIDDATENVTIATGKYVILDLNDNVLKAKTAGSVITNNGTLTVCDNAEDKTTRYFTDSDSCCAHGVTIGGNCIHCSGGTAVKDGCFETLCTEEGTPTGTEGTDYVKVTGGCITGGTGTTKDSVLWGGGVCNSGTMYLTGGNIVGNSAKFGGGMVLMENSAFTMSGGVVVGNAASADGAGVFIRADGSFTMNNGAKIAYNTAATGAGGVYVAGTFTMDGGEISGNEVGKSGAGVYVYYKNSTHPGVFTMNGGTIKNNTAEYMGGGVYVDNYATVVIGGAVTDNTSKNYGGGIFTKSNTTIKDTASIKYNTVGAATKVSGDLAVVKEHPITLDNFTGDVIGVSVIAKKAGVYEPVEGDFTTNGTTADKQYFTSDDNAFAVEFASKLSLKQTIFYVDAINGSDSTGTGAYSAPYKTIGAALIATGEKATTIKLLSDVTEAVTINQNQNITLDLNDHVLAAPEAANTRALLNWGTLNITDSDTTPTARYFTDSNNDGCYETCHDTNVAGSIAVSGGVITGGIKASGGDICGGGIFNGESGILILNGGNIVGNRATVGGGIANFGSSFTMNGGSIVGNSADNGGAVYNVGGNTFDMNAGTMQYNIAKNNGGAVYNRGTFNLKGGTIANCKTTSTEFGSGAGVMNIAQFTMSGGKITNCTSAYVGGAVFSDGHKDNDGKEPGDENETAFTMTNGEISGCTAPNHINSQTSKAWGDSVFIRYSVMNMTGGKIQGMVFTNDNPICGNNECDCHDESNPTYHVACDVNISGGYFDYTGLKAGSTTWAGKDWLASGCKVQANSSDDVYPFKVVGRSSSASDVSTYAVSSADAAHGSVSVDKKNAAAGATVTLTVKPDKGWTLETLTVKDAKGNEVELTVVKLGETYTFKMPEGDVTVTATFMEDNTMLNFFVDVKANDYFYDAVLWAATNGITSGVDDLHFAPSDSCDRAQVVTFLYRAFGAPDVTKASPFDDVSSEGYFANSVAWAAEKEITTGTGNGFEPFATVTRAQVVTFLWRAAGSPAAKSAETFADVPAGEYYSAAVAWAVENGITTGTGSGFEPNAVCNRAQVVTFLYRYLAK